jgi:hypothetical protein
MINTGVPKPTEAQMARAVRSVNDRLATNWAEVFAENPLPSYIEYDHKLYRPSRFHAGLEPIPPTLFQRIKRRLFG